MQKGPYLQQDLNIEKDSYKSNQKEEIKFNLSITQNKYKDNNYKNKRDRN